MSLRAHYRVCMQIFMSLSEARDDKGLTTTALAELSGVDAGTISRLERGIGDPKWSTVRALEVALKLKRCRLGFGQEYARV
jgi:transcriptional regulator with XRE-family HTH domain